MTIRPTTSAPSSRAPARAEPLPRWGWLEWTVVAQTAIPALMFIPGLTAVRTLTRVASFVIALAAWGAVVASGRRAPGRPFPAIWPLGVAAGWLALQVANPTTNNLTSGVAQAALNIAILCPAFWGGAALRSRRQIGRLMAILFLCNAAGTLMGIAQFYRPQTFNPPEIPMFKFKEGIKEALTYTTADGREVTRPCGLTDTPGAATMAGALTCLLGLCWALRPLPAWRRLAAFGLAMAGVAVLYLSQVRITIVTMGGCLAALIGLLALRGDWRRATLLGIGALVVFAAATAWVVRAGGSGMLDRFLTLFERPLTETYYNNRGHFLEYMWTEQIPAYPLGAGLGRWGQIYNAFADKTPSPMRGMLWSEVQLVAWLYDGGLPLILLYSAAILMALWNVVVIARHCPDEGVGFWAAAVGALGLNVVAQCFGSMPFIGPAGVQFWVLFAAIHAAAQLARLEKKPARGDASWS